MSLIPFNLLLLPLFHSFYAECSTFLKGYNKVTIDNVKIACPTNIPTYENDFRFALKIERTTAKVHNTPKKRCCDIGG